MDKKIIPIKAIPREVKLSDPQHIINERRRAARKKRIADVQERIQKRIEDFKNDHTSE